MPYSIVTVMYARFLFTLGDTLEAKPVRVRVGQVVDVTGQQAAHDLGLPDPPGDCAA